MVTGALFQVTRRRRARRRGGLAQDLSRWPSDLRSRVRFRAFTSLDSTQHFYDERCDVDRSSGAAVEQSELGWFDIRFAVDHDFLTRAKTL